MIRIGELDIDVAKSEEHRIENEATEFPVESGATITDHVRRKPRGLTVEGVVTDTPLHPDPVEAANGAKRSTTALAELERMFDPKAEDFGAVAIVTSLKRYASMLPLTLTIPRDRTTTGGLFFTAVFQELQTVTNARLAVRVSTVRGAAKRKLGSKTSKTPGNTGVVESGTFCRARDPKTGTCIDSQPVVVKRNPDGTAQWVYAKDGKPLSPEEQQAWSRDEGTAPGHEADFDPAQGTWVDKRTNQPVSRYPDRAYWDETGQPVQADNQQSKLDKTLLPSEGSGNGFWDSIGRQR